MAHQDRPHADRSSELASSLEAQLARCEAEIVAEVCAALLAPVEEIREDVESAFERLQAGTYGYCADCCLPIDDAYLEAASFPIRCRTCAKAREDRGAAAARHRRLTTV